MASAVDPIRIESRFRDSRFGFRMLLRIQEDQYGLRKREKNIFN